MTEPKPENTTPWHRLHGQFLSRKPTRSMLVDGFKITENCSLKGEPNPKTVKAYREVVYDKKYVIEYLIKKVIEPLYPMKWNDYQALLSEAYKTHKERVEKS